VNCGEDAGIALLSGRKTITSECCSDKRVVVIKVQQLIAATVKVLVATRLSWMINVAIDQMKSRK